MSSDKPSSRSAVIKPDAPRYRVNFFGPDGKVLRSKPIEASNDAEAIHRARLLMDGRALDLWHGLRFVEFFPPIEEAPAD